MQFKMNVLLEIGTISDCFINTVICILASCFEHEYYQTFLSALELISRVLTKLMYLAMND